MATLFQILQFFDANGDPLSLGKLYWYAAGTTTFQDTYIDQGETGSSPNPVILDQEGRIPSQNGVWLRGSYKLKITDSTDTEILTLDDINEYDQRDWTGLTATIADLNSTTTTALSKVATYSIVVGDRNKTILCNTSSASFVVYLPTAALAGNKFRIFIKKTDATTNNVQISPVGSETIDGQTNFFLKDYNDFVGLQSDGNNWHLISGNKRGTVQSSSSSGSLILDNHNELLNVSASGGIKNITLPVATSVGRGYRVKIKKIDSSSNPVNILTPGSETIDGAATLALTSQWQAVMLVTDSTNWFIEAELENVTPVTDYPYGYLQGLKIENDSGDTEHDINFNIGAARDQANAINLNFTTALVKRIDANWAAGTGNGGFPSALTLAANTWYHCFVIGKTDGTVDAGFDTSLTAANLLADATGYTGYRRVGAVRTDASQNIYQFFHYVTTVERKFLWITPELEVNVSDSGGSAVLRTLKTPLGIETNAIINVQLDFADQAGTQLYISYPGVTDQAPGFSAPLSSLDIGQRSGFNSGKLEVLTNTASQCRSRIDTPSAFVTLRISTLGWRE